MESEPTRRTKLLPRVIPVMDVMSGQVVHAVAGRRSEYQPIRSGLVHSTDPLIVAEALRSLARTDELYVADLDALQGRPRQRSLIAELARRGFRLWLDAGLRFADEASALFDVGVSIVIAGLETLEILEDVAILATDYGDHIAVSLDVREGQPMMKDRRRTWNHAIALAAALVHELEAKRLIFLDLERVGTSAGPGTLDLCRQIQAQAETVECLVGGGVRGPEDLPLLAAHGADAVLVATALHNGRFREFFAAK